MLKRLPWKAVAAAAVMAVAFGVYTMAFAAGGVRQNATLTGVAVADGLVQVGQTVQQGDVLVKVKTVAGAMPASRATVGGKVTAVFVTAGAKVTSGEAVAEITP